MNVGEVTSDSRLKNIRIYELDGNYRLHTLRLAEQGTYVKDRVWNLTGVTDTAFEGQRTRVRHIPQMEWYSVLEPQVLSMLLVKPDRMVQPERARQHPLEAFLGRAGVVDTYTREEEDAFEYVCRHTLLRPRDLMTIGDKLMALRPEERRHEFRPATATSKQR